LDPFELPSAIGIELNNQICPVLRECTVRNQDLSKDNNYINLFVWAFKKATDYDKNQSKYDKNHNDLITKVKLKFYLAPGRRS